MMKMQSWLNARSAQLLTDLNNTPLTDECEEIKLQLILTAMRESSIEMFHRASENSRKEIEEINNKAMQESIHEVEDAIQESLHEVGNAMKESIHKTDEASKDDLGPLNIEIPKRKKAKTKKPESKIKLKSSVIRRVDSF